MQNKAMERVYKLSFLFLIVAVAFFSLVASSDGRTPNLGNHSAKSANAEKVALPTEPEPTADVNSPGYNTDDPYGGQMSSVDGVNGALYDGYSQGSYGGAPYGYGFPFPGSIFGFPFGFPRGIFGFPGSIFGLPGLGGFPGGLGGFPGGYGGFPGGYGGNPGGYGVGGPGGKPGDGGYGGGWPGGKPGDGGYGGGGPGGRGRAEVKNKGANSP